MTLLNWLEHNLERDSSDDGITLQEIISKCNKDRHNCGLPLVDLITLGRLVIKYFQIGISAKVIASNVPYSLKWRNHNSSEPFNIGNDTSFIKATGWHVDSTTESTLVLVKVIEFKINNLNVEKKVEFRGDRWSLKIADKPINLNDFDVDDHYTSSQDGILTVLAVVDHISVCRGRKLKVGNAINSLQNATFQNTNPIKNDTQKLLVRSVECVLAVPVTSSGDTCSVCGKISENAKFLPSKPKKRSSCVSALDTPVVNIKEEHNYANEESLPFHQSQPEGDSNKRFQQTSKKIIVIGNNVDLAKQSVSRTLASSVNVKSSAINGTEIAGIQNTVEPMSKNVPSKIEKSSSNAEDISFIPHELWDINNLLIPASTSNMENKMEIMSQSGDLNSHSKSQEQYGVMQGVPVLSGVLSEEDQRDSLCNIMKEDGKLRPCSKRYESSLTGKDLMQYILLNEQDKNDFRDLHIALKLQDNDNVTQLDSVSRETNVFKDDREVRDIHTDNVDVKSHPDDELLSNAQSQANSKAPDTELYRVYYFEQKPSGPFDKGREQTIHGRKTLCKVCNKNFRTMVTFRNHKQTYKHFKCDICTSSYFKEIDLMTHLMTSHKINVKCGLCNKKLKSVFRMRNHLKRYLHFKCNLCKNRFETNMQLATHSMKHSLKPYSCKHCSQLFTCGDDLIAHFNSAHRFNCKQCSQVFTSRQDLKMHFNSADRSCRLFDCKLCSEVFTSRQDLKMHFNSAHRSCRLFDCKLCSDVFTSRQDLRTHVQSRHEEKQLVCRYCMRCFIRKDGLKRHLRIHTGEKPYLCDACPERFTRSSSLCNHKKNAHMGKTFICVDCNRAFSTIHYLNFHRRIHTGEKLFHCQHCPKYFLTSFELENHIRVHTGESPFMCEYCSKCFKQAYNLTTHRRRVHLGEKSYKCEECLKQFTQKSSLVVHRRLHTGEKPYKCEQCSKQFALKDRLNSHMRLHTKEFQCEHCSKCFENESSLVVHRRLHTGEKPYKCEQCSKCFRSGASLYYHRRIHSDKKLLKCEQCSKQFALKDRLKSHMRLHTKEFQCEHCSKCFENESSLVVHRRLHTGEKPYKCEQCSKCFRLRASMYVHKSIHSDEKPFKCEYCPSQFRLKTSLRKHLAMHTKRYKCKTCLKSFEMKKELLLHTKTHIEDKKFKCSHCSRHFTNEASLIKHRKLHADGDTFQCEHCSKQFKFETSLKKHMKWHTISSTIGKKFKCEHCSKVFSQRRIFLNHVRIHTGEKPFQCEFCSQFFRQLITLMVHRRIHTGEKPFKCEYCPKSFREKVQMGNHRRIHTGEKPFQCEFCSKCFRVQGSLRMHRKTHTGEVLS